jgi:Fic family protein
LSDPDRNKISGRLQRLATELLLALLNATAILVIIAAILTLVAMAHINNFAGNVATTMTEAALAKIDLPSRDVLANLRNLTEEVRTLGNTLKDIKLADNPAAQSRIERLKDALTALNASIDRLATAKTILSDEAIKQLAATVTDTLMKMKGCPSNISQMQPVPRDKGSAVDIAPEAWLTVGALSTFEFDRAPE